MGRTDRGMERLAGSSVRLTGVARVQVLCDSESLQCLTLCPLFRRSSERGKANSLRCGVQEHRGRVHSLQTLLNSSFSARLTPQPNRVSILATLHGKGQCTATNPLSQNMAARTLQALEPGNPVRQVDYRHNRMIDSARLDLFGHKQHSLYPVTGAASLGLRV